ncbi:MAG: chromate transporter [Bacteroidetes bacterium]|nr:MAG: chromate transporter [Bacteroidota bacterium]
MSHPNYSTRQIAIYFLKLGTTGFGGPVALVEFMHRDLVEKFGWISEEEFKDGLALAQLAPGPLAAQLAIYIGYVHYKLKGATLAGLAFVLPSFLMVIALGWLYTEAGGLPWIQSLFYGIGASVIGIISMGGYKLVKKTLKKDWLLWGIFLIIMIFTFLSENENIWLIVSAGLVAWIVKTKRKIFQLHADSFMAPIFIQVSSFATADEKLLKMGWFFLKAGAFVFGSGLAIVPFLYGGVVKEFGWLNDRQFLDAVAVAMITPGPVVITVGFIGYLVAGLPGASIAALATFLPCFLFTVIPAPYFKKYGNKPGLRAFVDGITAAAVGAIGGAVLVLAKRQLVDVVSIMIATISIGLLIRFRKLPEPLLILFAALAGLLIKGLH